MANRSYNRSYSLYSPSTIPAASRASARTFGGVICPEKAEFGYVHGTSAARGTITYSSVSTPRAGENVQIQVGQSVFHGICVKVERSFTMQSGGSTTISLVDMRDRLHDEIYAAQYNMMDQDGNWYHIIPFDGWYNQTPIYTHSLKSIEDFSKEQEIQEPINEISTEDMPLLSGKTLLNEFASRYDFTYSATEYADQRLKEGYPNNLDFNPNGGKVIDWIDTICSKLNLQFTCWGDLHMHITSRGVPDNEFDEKMLAGNFDPCEMKGFFSGNIGAELNESGRIVHVIGSRNQHEAWYPCYPLWNYEAWTDKIINQTGFALSSLLISKGLTESDLLGSTGVPYREPDDKKLGGRKINEMTIGDYIKNVCFKSYVVDFGTPLKDLSSEKTRLFGILDEKFEFKGQLFGYIENIHWLKDKEKKDTVNPISQSLVSDSGRQFLVKATSRKFNSKGVLEKDFFEAGEFSIIDDGVSLEIQESISKGLSGDHNKIYKAILNFSERKYLAYFLENKVKNESFWFSVPDKVYVLLSIDSEMYHRYSGDDSGIPRSRPIIKSVPELRRRYIYGVEQSIMAVDFKTSSYDNDVYPNDIAREISEDALSHESITASGSLSFTTISGFYPSGIVDSVNITFDSKQGVNETINFTNAYNNDRIRVIQQPVRRIAFKTDDERQADHLRRTAKGLLGQARVKQAVPIAHDSPESNMNSTHVSQAYGGVHNSAMVQVIPSQFKSGEILAGEILVVTGSA